MGAEGDSRCGDEGGAAGRCIPSSSWRVRLHMSLAVVDVQLCMLIAGNGAGVVVRVVGDGGVMEVTVSGQVVVVMIMWCR